MNTFFIGGEHTVELTLKYNKKLINYIVCTTNKEIKVKSLLEKYQSKARIVIQSENKIKLLFKNYLKHQNIAANINKEKIENSNVDVCKNNDIIVFEELHDNRNIGSIIRTALGFGIKDFFFNKKNSDIYNEYIYQASSGYINLANCHHYTNLSRLIANSKENGFWISGLDSNANQNIYKFDWPEKNIIIVGNEHLGLKLLTKKNCDYLLNIPIENNVESFNVSNALAITLAIKKSAQ
jgi:23S rRNA (guanosine2251-2'-O)-methyltransferase